MRKRALLVAVFISGLAIQGFGQSQTTGSISGFVQDTSRAVLPGVEIQTEQEGTGLKRIAVSGETGSYTVPLLPPGRYTVSFSLPGFRMLNNRDIVVNATERLTLNVMLQVADVGTTVDVSAVAQLVQTESTALGRVIDQRLTVALPLPTKNYTQLLALSTGTVAAVADTATLGRGSINISSGGARVVANSFMLDGVDANNIHQNMALENTVGSNGAPVPSTEVIQEFKVQTSQYDAQSGRNAGASINVISRSGTNEFRGVAYYYLRNDAFNANNFFFNSTGARRPVLKQNQWGVTLGGPIKRDKTFFFIGYQGTRQVNGASLSNSQRSLVLPPIPQVRTRAALGEVFGGQSGRNGGVAVARDGSNINPVSMTLLNYRWPNGEYLIPSPQRSGPGVNYSVSVPARFEEEQISISLDQDFTSSNRLSLRMFGANSPQTKAFAQGTNPPGFPTNQDFKNRNAVVTNVATISPTTVNEARVGWNTPFGDITLPTPLSIQDIGMTRVNPDTVPQIPSISVSGAFTLGYGGSSPQTIDPTTYTFQDTLSLTRGSHMMRFGGELRRHQTDIFTAAFRGSISFLSFADFLLAMPGGPTGNGTGFSNIRSASVTSGVADKDYRAWDVAGFFQDDWKMSPQLTLNLGVRYDFMTFQWDALGNTGNFDPRLYQAPPPGGQTSAGFVMPEKAKNPFGLPVVSKSLVDRTPKKNFAPRIGFAYRLFPDKSLVLRGGYGIFYERISNQPILQAGNTPNFRTNGDATGAEAAYASFQRPFLDIPPIAAHPRVPLLFGPPYNVNRPLLGGSPLDPELDTPYLQHYSVNLQYELYRNLLLEIGYAGSKGTKLPVKISANQAILASPERPVNGLTVNTAANAVQRVPYIGYSANGLGMNRNIADSRYHSLQGSLTKRFSAGLQFLASYTWAKSLDNNSGAFGSTLSTASGDQRDMRQNRGLSDYDRKHRFVFSHLYEIPAWGFGLNDTPFGRRFFSGWQLSGVFLTQGGAPLTIVDTSGARFHGVSTSRASWAPGATTETATLDTPIRSRLARYFNTAAFVRAGDYFGNLGRNNLRGPGQTNLDLSLAKNTRIAETMNVEWRMEVFNVLNQTNFADPETSITSSSFGTIRATSSNARLIQFGLRIVY